MRNFKQWFTERFPKENLPSSMSGKWFAEHGLPMIVSCTCCTSTMALPNAMIDEDGQIYCSSCAEGEGEEDSYSIEDLGPNWY